MRFSKIWAIMAVFTLVLSFFFLVLPTTPVSADNICTWAGGAGGDWSDPDNWTDCDDNVPGVDDTALINSGNPVVGSDASVGSVTVGTNGGLTIDAGATLTIVDTFTQNNEIDGEGDMIIEGHWYWLRGNHSGSGETTLSSGGQMTITLNTSTQLNRTIINNGEALWNQHSINSFAGEGLFINNGVFTVVHDATFNSASFDNQGSFIKTGSSGVVSFNANRFTNDGSVSVETGTLYLLGSGSVMPPVDSGNYTADPGALLRFGNVNRTLTADSSVNANQVLVSSGSLNINGNYIVATTATDGSGNINWHGPTAYSLPVVDHDGSSIGGDAPLLIEQEFIWRSGNINGTSPMTMTNASSLDISLASSSQLNRTLVNEGTAVWSSGNLTSSSFGLGTLVNNNLLTTSHSANATASFFNLINNGRFIKTGDADLRFSSNPTAQNNGEIHVAAGSLTFAGGLGNYANNTLTGGTFVVTGTLRIQNADIQTNQADVALHTAAAAIQTSAPVPTDGLVNFAENGADGRFALRDGAAITLPHSLTNQGELIIGSQSNLTSNDYQQNNSNATTTIEVAGALTVNGTLTNDGLLRQTIDNVAGPTTFLGMGGYGGVTIDPTGNMGPTTIEIRGNQDCTNEPSSQPVRRCFDIEPDMPQTATITFYYAPGEANGNPENAVNAYRWTGSAWQPAGGTPSHSSGADPRWVEVPDVSSYSPFVLDNQTPTAVSLTNIGVNTTVSPLVVLLLLLMVAGTVLGTATVRQ